MNSETPHDTAKTKGSTSVGVFAEECIPSFDVILVTVGTIELNRVAKGWWGSYFGAIRHVL